MHRKRKCVCVCMCDDDAKKPRYDSRVRKIWERDRYLAPVDTLRSIILPRDCARTRKVRTVHLSRVPFHFRSITTLMAHFGGQYDCPRQSPSARVPTIDRASACNLHPRVAIGLCKMMSSEMTSVSSAKDEDCPSRDTREFKREASRPLTTIDSIASKFIISLLAILTAPLEFPMISISLSISPRLILLHESWIWRNFYAVQWPLCESRGKSAYTLAEKKKKGKERKEILWRWKTGRQLCVAVVLAQIVRSDRIVRLKD